MPFRATKSLTLVLFLALFAPTPLVAVQPPLSPRPLTFDESFRHGVAFEAAEAGVSPRLALCIVEHESRFQPDALGDVHLTCPATGEPMRSRGLWQINDCFHPEVSDDVAFSGEDSTEWALARIKQGHAEEWSTYDRCKHL
jgi:hypothetical protein